MAEIDFDSLFNKAFKNAEYVDRVLKQWQDRRWVHLASIFFSTAGLIRITPELKKKHPIRAALDEVLLAAALYVNAWAFLTPPKEREQQFVHFVSNLVEPINDWIARAKKADKK